MTAPDIDTQAIASHPATWGFVGSLIALRWAPGATWIKRAANVASGVALTWVTVPVAADWLHLTTAQIAMGGAAVGMFGLNVADQVTKGIKGVDFAATFNGWLNLLSGKGR